MKREIHSKLLSMIRNKNRNEVIIVAGARQVGKSFVKNKMSG